LVAALHIDIEKADSQTFNRFYEDLHNRFAQVKNLLAQGRTPETEKIAQDVQRLTDRLEFIAHLKNDLYLQIPLTVRDRQMNGELYVFRQKKQRRKGGDGDASALVALDTAALGRFEVYLQKNNRNITCQFRLQDASVDTLVRKNIDRLERMLADRQYTLGGYSFRRQEEPFSPLGRDPGAASVPPGDTAFDTSV
jgi:flagellar hook-length control protein FliK